MEARGDGGNPAIAGPTSSATDYPAADENLTALKLRILGIFGQHDDHPDYYSNKTEGLLRYRLQVTDPDDKEFEQAHFRPVDGLVWTDNETGEQTPHEFFHTKDDADLKEKERGDRAVLFQSIENYETVATSSDFAEYFHLADKKDYVVPGEPLDSGNRKLLRQRVLDRPTFGEQIIVQGARPSDISLGDIFEVVHGASTLRVQVTSPRKPCFWIDRKNKTPMGPKGIKAFAQSRGLAGWFTKVLVAGDLKDGMELVRTHHPHPEWTLQEVSQALFGGEGNPDARMRGKASWGRSRKELCALLDVEILAAYEWKNEVEKLMVTIPDEAEVISGLPKVAFPFKLNLFGDVLEALCSGPCAMGCLPESDDGYDGLCGAYGMEGFGDSATKADDEIRAF